MRMQRHFFAFGIASVLALGPFVCGAEWSPALSWNCNGCHGPSGVSSGQSIPSIAGLDKRYFFKVMRDLKSNDRESTIMGRIARGYKTAELRRMAEHFSSNDWVDAKATASEEQFLAGQVIHDELCVECHEDAGRYQDKEIPRLAGQWPAYLFYQLLDYQSDQLKMPQPDKMRDRVRELSKNDLEAVSRFYGRVDNEFSADDRGGAASRPVKAESVPSR